MASRNRKRTLRYGGWPCGIMNGATVLENAYLGDHICIDETHPGPPYRTGGPFSVTKKQVFMTRTKPYEAHAIPFVPVQHWSGHLYVYPYIPGTAPTPTSLSGWGAKGWNRAYPVHPIYSLGVSIAELRDFPRMITQTWKFFQQIRSLRLTTIPKTLGDLMRDIKNGTVESSGHYLNLQFGWVPFAQDLAFIAKMESKLRQKIAWLRRRQNKPFRREFEMDKQEFSEEIARTVSPITTVGPTLPTVLYAGNIVATKPFPVTRSVYSRIWFSSKWRLHMPELNDHPEGSSRLKAQLAGIDLDASIIYNLVPWSWLLDWFTNVGSVLQNIYFRAKNQAVAEYAYVMCKTIITYAAPGYVDVNVGTSNFGGPFSGGQTRKGGISTTVYTFLQREVANPFGFGITFASLSAYQMSILAALGLSRGGKNLALRT